MEFDLKRYFRRRQLSDIQSKFALIEEKTNNLTLKYVAHPFFDRQAREYAHHGFARRVGTLRRCIENIFKTVPPGTVRVPSKSKLYDAQINAQAFIANVYGCIDNLAWIWIFERGLAGEIPRNRVGLRKHHTEVRSSLSPALQKYLAGIDDWLNYIVEYRDALAHRIPLYIPPGAVHKKDVPEYNRLSGQMTKSLNDFDGLKYEKLSEKQNALLVFQPFITHSITETTAHYAFHVQSIADFLTIEELGLKVLKELHLQSSKN